MLVFNCIRRVVPVAIQVGTPPVTNAHRVGFLVLVQEPLIVLIARPVLCRTVPVLLALLANTLITVV